MSMRRLQICELDVEVMDIYHDYYPHDNNVYLYTNDGLHPQTWSGGGPDTDEKL